MKYLANKPIKDWLALENQEEVLEPELANLFSGTAARAYRLVLAS